jgi:hypothetical protein
MKMLDEITSEQIAQNYTAMGHSVALINDIIAGDAMADDTAEDKQDCVDRNVGHLEIMVAKDYWTSEDMTAANAAISSWQRLHSLTLRHRRLTWVKMKRPPLQSTIQNTSLMT